MSERSRREGATRAMQTIQEDVERDTHRREGMAFTGYAVGTALGELAAQIGAIAHAVELLLADQEEAGEVAVPSASGPIEYSAGSSC